MIYDLRLTIDESNRGAASRTAEYAIRNRRRLSRINHHASRKEPHHV